MFESKKGLLFYPVQYEGWRHRRTSSTPARPPTSRSSRRSTTCSEGKKKTKFFLLGSDYVFPRTANKIIKAQLKAARRRGGRRGVHPLGQTDRQHVISKIRRPSRRRGLQHAQRRQQRGLLQAAQGRRHRRAEQLPTLSVSVAEEEVRGIGAENMVGHLTAWNYYQTTDTPENKKFVAAYKAKYGANRVTDDPIEAGYFGVYLWSLAVEKAGSIEVDKVQAAAKGLDLPRPEGLVKIDGENQHISKTARIGEVRRPTAMFDEIWTRRRAGQARSVPEDLVGPPSWAREAAERAARTAESMVAPRRRRVGISAGEEGNAFDRAPGMPSRTRADAWGGDLRLRSHGVRRTS